MTHVLTLSEFSQSLRPRCRLLGLDVGTKTIGLALSDTTHTIATPMETMKRKKWKDDVVKMQNIVEQHDIGGFVIGLPLNMDGTDSPRTQGVRAFARNMMQAFDLPVCFWDERWSTAAVERTLLEADSSRAKRAEVVDKMAASYILQGAMHGL